MKKILSILLLIMNSISFAIGLGLLFGEDEETKND